MGETLEHELKSIIADGLDKSLPDLTELRKLKSYHPITTSDQQGSDKQKMTRMLTQALTAWEKEASAHARAMRILIALDAPPGHARRLNRGGGRRDRAGKNFNVGYDQFARTLEKPLIKDFAEFLECWDGPARPEYQASVRFSFDEVKEVADNIARKIEQQFAPDLVITMSGPGSFAAFYVTRFNSRDVPVLTAVTFPKHESAHAAEKLFKDAAEQCDWIHFTTEKWSVYVPDVVRSFKKGANITLFDDRVVSGEAQQCLNGILTELGFRVSCAALFGPPEAERRGVLIGRLVTGKFDMPWGPSAGRT